jgi:hypothetical protein
MKNTPFDLSVIIDTISEIQCNPHFIFECFDGKTNPETMQRYQDTWEKYRQQEKGLLSFLQNVIFIMDKPLFNEYFTQLYKKNNFEFYVEILLHPGVSKETKHLLWEELKISNHTEIFDEQDFNTTLMQLTKHQISCSMAWRRDQKRPDNISGTIVIYAD